MGSNSIKNLSKSCRFLRIPYTRSKSLFKIFDNALAYRPQQLSNRSFHQPKDVPKKIPIPKNPPRPPPNSCSSSSTTASSNTGFLGWYLSKLDSNPVITKGVTASIIYTAADVTSQMISSQPGGSYDTLRTLRMAAYGLVILGPSQHLWFNSLSKILAERDVLTTLKKILMGQVLYGPCITSVFYSYNAALQGESAIEIAARLKRDLLPTLMNGLVFWPICDFFTFKFVPVRLQPLVNSSFAYIWTIYLTYMASLKGVEAVRAD